MTLARLGSHRDATQGSAISHFPTPAWFSAAIQASLFPCSKCPLGKPSVKSLPFHQEAFPDCLCLLLFSLVSLYVGDHHLLTWAVSSRSRGYVLCISRSPGDSILPVTKWYSIHICCLPLIGQSDLASLDSREEDCLNECHN